MIKYVWIIVIAFFSSCCSTHVEVTYSYKDIVITRIDQCGVSSFYYKKKDGTEKPGKIVVRYSGINDGFSGYLRFEDNSRVGLLSGDGYFKTVEMKDDQFYYKRILAADKPKLGDSVCRIMLSTKYEKERNIEAGSKVKIEYRID